MVQRGDEDEVPDGRRDKERGREGRKSRSTTVAQSTLVVSSLWCFNGVAKRDAKKVEGSPTVWARRRSVLCMRDPDTGHGGGGGKTGRQVASWHGHVY